LSLPAPNADAVSLDRDAALDGVRGVAVGMVLVIHCLLLPAGGLLTRLWHNVAESMFIGVDLFFVLSGYLITSILLRTRERPGYFRSFYWRRVLRILPAYALVLAYIFGLRTLFLPPAQAAELHALFPWFALFLQNFVGILTPPLTWPGAHHLWSLAIEEQFYLAWPLVALFVAPRRLLWVCAALVLGADLCRFALLATGASWNTLYAVTPVRVDGLAAGGFVACWMKLTPRTPWPRALHLAGLAAGLGLLVLLVQPSTTHKLFVPQLVAWHNALTPIAFAWLLFLLVGPAPHPRLRALFTTAPLRFLGRYSYGLYLVHLPFWVEVRGWLLPALTPTLGGTGAALAGGLIGIGGAIAVAVLMFHGVEAPALALKDRVPRRAVTAGPAT
jgi:peptidoglycan/LPS O-acetylase OafA/YrhL